MLTHIAVLEDAPGDVPRRRIGEKNRRRKKQRRRRPGNFGQQISCARRPKHRLAGTTEDRADIRALALLQQDDNHQRDANGDMNDDRGRYHEV